MIIKREKTGKEWRKCFCFIPRKTEDDIWIWLESCEAKMFYCPVPNVCPSSWAIYRRVKGGE